MRKKLHFCAVCDRVNDFTFLLFYVVYNIGSKSKALKLITKIKYNKEKKKL